MNLPENPDFLCSVLSAELGEPLYGTAVHATIWFLLEMNQAWTANAIQDNRLSPAVNEWLSTQVEAGEKRRIQFLRHSSGFRNHGISFFVADVREKSPFIYRFKLNRYQDLFDLDVEAILNEDDRYGKNLYLDPLFLVCTNGKRDRCCARFGAAFYRELVCEVGPAAWQTTHLGGHRFAATALVLPYGVSYGRLTQEDVESIVKAQKSGEFSLERLRGRTCYEPVIQTAEYFLRSETGQLQLASFRYISSEPEEDNLWRVNFIDTHGITHQIILLQESEPLELYASCGQMKIKRIPRYRLLDYISTR